MIKVENISRNSPNSPWIQPLFANILNIFLLNLNSREFGIYFDAWMCDFKLQHNYDLSKTIKSHAKSMHEKSQQKLKAIPTLGRWDSLKVDVQTLNSKYSNVRVHSTFGK